LQEGEALWVDLLDGFLALDANFLTALHVHLAELYALLLLLELVVLVLAFFFLCLFLDAQSSELGLVH